MTKYHQRGYTLVSSPSKRPILSTFLSIVAWHVISLAHSIGNQPLSPSRSLSPSYQPAKKSRVLMGHQVFGWILTVQLRGRTIWANFRGSILPQVGYQGWCKVREREVEQGKGFKRDSMAYHDERQNMIRGPEVRCLGEYWAWAELQKGMMFWVGRTWLLFFYFIEV